MNKYELKIGNYTTIPVADKNAAIDLAEGLLGHFKEYSLMNELNNFQTQVADCITRDEYSTSPFENKYTIPDYFINLLLRNYCMKIQPKKE